MQSEKELDDYFCSLLDLKSVVHKQFLTDLKKRYRLCKYSDPLCFIDVFHHLI